MSTNEFPTVSWGATEATFLPVGTHLPTVQAPCAALVFAFTGLSCVVADIIDRGWCIPSGRLEPGETPEMAARREALEEAGLILGSLQKIGSYLLYDADPPLIRTAPVFIAEVEAQQAMPPGFESRGTMRLTLDELPHRYFRWDPLIEAVARYAFSVRAEQVHAS